MNTDRVDSFKRFHVFRAGSGLALSQNNPPASMELTGKTVSDLMKIPCSVWFLDGSGATIAINREGANICGFESEQAAFGQSIMAVSEEGSGKTLIDNCRQVITAETFRIFEESLIRKDRIEHHFLSVKLPMYDSSEKISGVCGFSIVLGSHPLSSILNELVTLGILSRNPGMTSTVSI